MDINRFAKKVCESEGLKKQVNVAQVKELLAVVNKKLFGILYLIVRMIPK